MDLGVCYETKAMKCVKTKYGNKLVITVDFKGEEVAPKRFDSKAADFEKKL